MAAPLTHCTAVVLIPPEDLWEPVQAIRREHDPQIGRWMPHVTLLYPFLPEWALPGAAETLRAVCGGRAPFTVVLSEFRWFVHGRKTATLWLAPEAPEPVVALHAALLAAFPQCDHTARFERGYTPHLSVGRWPAARAGEAAAFLQAGWTPREWPVGHLSLITRPSGGGPFAVREEVRLDPALH